MPSAPPRYKQQTVGSKPPERRKTAHARGYGSKWEAFRKNIIATHVRKFGPLCACGCGTILRTGQPRHPHNAEVDHIKAVSGPSDPLFWAKGNHQVLCKSCHSTKTANEDGSFGNKPKVKPKTGTDGWLIEDK